MDEFTALIRNEILSQFGTLQQFVNVTGIHYSTLNSAIHRGFGGSSYEFVTKVCRLLGMKRLFDEEIPEMSREQFKLAKEMEGIDQQGLDAIRAKIAEEKARCEKRHVIKSYDGKGSVPNDEHIKQLIREVLAEERDL